jgi:cell division initiation protein
MADNKILFDDRDDLHLNDIRLSSQDILNQQFSTKFRGYDVQEVDSFIEAIAKELDRISNDNIRLQEDMIALRREVAAFREKEKNINDALVTLQKIGNNMKENAHKEASLIISEAQLEAEKIIVETRQQQASVLREIDALKDKRLQLETALRSLLEAHMSLLDRASDGE